MAAPDRRAVVKRVLEQHDRARTVPAAEVNTRRQLFARAIAEAMPAEDGGNWGLLLKTDKNPDEIESDILVWRPTMEHIDILTHEDLPDGTCKIHAVWKNQGVIGQTPGTRNKVGLWKWLDPKASNLPPLPGAEPPRPPAPPEQPGDEFDRDDFELLLLADMNRIRDGIESIAAAMKTIADRVGRF